MAAGRIIVPPYFPARDRNGDLISGALLYVWANNTTTLVTIYADENLTVPAANPAVANASGQFPPVWAEAGTDEEPVLYRVGVTKSTGAAPGNDFIFDDYRPSVDYETAALALAEAAAAAAVGASESASESADTAADYLAQIEDIAQGAPDAPSVLNKANRSGNNVYADQFKRNAGVVTQSLSSLRALGGGIVQSVFVEGRSANNDEYAGVFEWVAGNQSANVAADALGGVWVAPSGQSGSVGAWKRVFVGAIDAVWFGGRTSGAINAALAYAKLLGGQQTVKASGIYTMTETVRYEGGTLDGIHFDGIEAIFRRMSDYGPTFYVSGLANGTALQRTSWTFGELLDLNNSMTVGVSRCHVLFDHVYFLNWSAPYIREGCGGVHILGCASWSDMGGVQAWRFSGPYQAGSRGYLIGASELAGSLGLKGGDAHVGSLTDVYGGRAVLGLTGGTSGSSTTITMASTAGVEVGDIVEGSGWNQGDDPNALIPDGTTVVTVNSGSIVVSVPVTLPAATALIFFKPTIEDGIVLEAIDGLWVEGMLHSIFCKRRSVSIDSGADREIFNFRINVMPDVAPGIGLYVGGSATLVSGLIDVHHLYGGKITVSAPLNDVTIWSPQERWSLDGFTYGGQLAARGARINAGIDGYNMVGMHDPSGFLRVNQYRAPTGEFGTNVHDAAGAYLHNAENHNPATRISTYHYAIRPPVVTVAGLSVFTPTQGAMAFASNARALTTGGSIEGAGAGTGACVTYNGTKWVLTGTNIDAQA